MTFLTREGLWVMMTEHDWYQIIQKYTTTYSPSLPTVGMGIFFLGILSLRKRIPGMLFTMYSICRGRYKKWVTPQPYVPLCDVVPVGEIQSPQKEDGEKHSSSSLHPHQMSLWLMNIQNVELFGYQHTEMDDVICRGIEKFRIQYDPCHHQKSYSVNLWEIAKQQYDQIYKGNKDFPQQIIIRLSPETLLFTRMIVSYLPDHTIVLSPETVNNITFL